MKYKKVLRLFKSVLASAVRLGFGVVVTMVVTKAKKLEFLAGLSMIAIYDCCLAMLIRKAGRSCT